MKPDERLLLRELQGRTRRSRSGYVYIRDLVRELGLNERRASYVLNKWISKGWLECGVSEFSGWLTPSGLSVDPDKYPGPGGES